VLVATFNRKSAWPGRPIDYYGHTFVLADHGPITAAHILAYRRQGVLDVSDDFWRALDDQRRAASAPPTPREPGRFLAALGDAVDGVADGWQSHQRSSANKLIHGGLFVGIWLAVIIIGTITAGLTAVFYGAAAGLVSAALVGLSASLIIAGVNKAHERRK
jgi:hypothetical protein